MWRAAGVIRASVTIAVIAIAVVGAVPPTDRAASPQQVKLGSYDARASHSASDAMGRSEDGHDGEMCWYDPDVPRCE
jgi:hypothetical protein